MKYASFDIHTTGLDPVRNDILEIAVIVEDTATKLTYDEAPKLRFWIDKEYYRGTPFALVANVDILKKISDLRAENSRRLVKPDDAFTKIANFLRPHFAENNVFKKPIVVAGKNFQSRDKAFLSRLKDFENIPFCPRVLEPSTLFMKWDSDEIPPGLTECKARLGLGEGIKHDTLLDAWDVIQVLRSQY